MLNKNMEIRAQWSPWYAGIELMVRSQDEAALVCHVGRLTMEEGEPGQIIGPTATLDRRTAQQLMDDLWHCGLRPSQARSGDTTLEATRAHLQDMRALAFAKSKVEAPR